MSNHKTHEGHDHQHGADCGHEKVEHDGHRTSSTTGTSITRTATTSTSTRSR